MDLTDIFLYDLKLMDDSRHRKYTGVSNRYVLENLEFLAANNKRIYIRFPVIPTINDDEANISRILLFLDEVAPAVEEVDLLPYHAMAAHKYEKFHMEYKMGGVPEPEEQEMEQLKARFEEAGFKVKVGG